MEMKKYIITSIALLTLSLLFVQNAEAQCAMCKATAEQSDVVGLNLGIFVLFFMPYLIVSTIGFLWWKNRIKDVDEPNKGLSSIKKEQLN